MTAGRFPCWSRDASYLVFMRNMELFTISNDAAKTVTKVTTAAQASELSGCDMNSDERIAYFMPRDSTRENSRLVVYMLHWVYYRYYPDFPIGTSARPRWSSDNKWILFVSNDLGPCVLDFVNGTYRQIMHSGLPGKVSWYKPGSFLYCIRGNLYALDMEGNELALLYMGGFYPGSIDYSMTAQKLAFSSSGIWIMDLEDNGG